MNKRTEYWREYASKNRARRQEIEKRSREKRKLAAQSLLLTDDECFLEPIHEGWARGRACRICGERVLPTSYYYCALHYYIRGEEEFVLYSTASLLVEY